MAVFYVWIFVSTKFWPELYRQPTTQPSGEQVEDERRYEERLSSRTMPGDTTTQPAGMDVSERTSRVVSRPAARSGPAEATSTPSAGRLIVDSAHDETPITLGSDQADGRFPMAVEIMPRGASIRRVRIRGHYETVAKRVLYPVIEPVPLLDRPEESQFLFGIGDGPQKGAGFEIANDLDMGILSAELQQAFVEHALPLGPETSSFVVKLGRRWLIGDQGSWYTLIEDRDVIRVYKTRLAYSFATQKIQFRFPTSKEDVYLDKVSWDKAEVSAERVVFSALVKSRENKQLVAKLTKSYTLPEQVAKKRKFQTYDLGLALKIENLSGEPMEAIVVQQGPIGFRKEATRSEDRRVICATWEQDEIVPHIKGHFRTELMKDTGRDLDLGGDRENERIAWVAEANNYFACIMTPVGRMGLQSPALFERVDAVQLTGNEAEAFAPDFTFRYISKPLKIPAGQSQEVAFECYVGPKSKPIFDHVKAYADRGYYAVISDYFYFCAPTAVVGVMMKLLSIFQAIPPHNYGIAIIFLVLVVKGLLHPITKKSQVNMTKMQKQMSRLQPKLQAAKEKYANDRVAMNQATMEIYREEGVNPAGNVFTCLPMFLQVPIWAGLWAALNSMIEMRHAPFDGWWIKDLTQPDALIAFGQSIQIPLLSGLMGGPITSFNLLPVLLGISQLLQTKFMPRGNVGASSSGNPDQLEQQRKMMMFMSGFFVLILYNAPSGLNLYIMASNLFGIIEQYRIRKHLAEMDAKEEKQAAEAKLAGKTTPTPKTPRKKSWLHRKWEQLEKEAQDTRQLESQPKKEKVKKAKAPKR